MTRGPARTGPTADPATRPSAGTCRAAARGWPVLVPVVAGQALVQTLLVLGDPVATGDPSFAARVVASAAALVLMVATLAIAALAAVDGRPFTGAGTWRRLVPVAGWTIALGVLAGAASVVAIWLGPVLLLPGLLLPAVAAAPGNPVPPMVRAVRNAPGRALTTLVGFVLLAAVSWVIALLLGFLVTGPAAAALTWLWFGSGAAVVLCAGAALLRRGGWTGPGTGPATATASSGSGPGPAA